MSNPINSRTSSLKISIDAGRNRQTPKTNFPGLLKKGLATAAQAASVVAPFIPAAPVLTAAVSGLQSSGASLQSSTSTGGNAVQVSTGGGGGTVSGTGSASLVGGTSSSSGSASGEMDMMSRTEKLQEMNQTFNLQYLNLQQSMQSENRKFTSISNVMKTKHDTAKSTIQNVR